jgi:hypothetical protein
MKWLNKGNFGVVLGVGGALSIIAWYDDNPVLAGLLAALTIAGALYVYWKFDRPQAGNG